MEKQLSSDEIIATSLENVIEHSKKVLANHDKLVSSYVVMQNDPQAGLTTNEVAQGIEFCQKQMRRVTNLYFTNAGKMLYDGPDLEILGTYNFWKSKAVDVEKIQKTLIQILYLEKETMRTLIKIKEIRDQSPKDSNPENKDVK